MNTYQHWRRIRGGNPEAYVRRVMHHAHISWWRHFDALTRLRDVAPQLLADVPPEQPGASTVETEEVPAG